MTSDDYKYDIVVSFAGEDRTYVEDLVKRCKSNGYSVFYDDDEATTMWGQDLTELFARIYEKESRFAIMFISEHYARKAWTIHERRSILQRALEQAPSTRIPYLLPIRIDETPLPGLRGSIGYLDSHTLSPEDIAEIIQKKVGEPMKPEIEFNWRTPRTDEEAEYVLSQRPDGWEHYYTAFMFEKNVRELDSLTNDVRNGFFEPGVYIDDMEVAETCTRDIAAIKHISTSFENLLNGPAQESAWGKSGEPGDVSAIECLADSYRRILKMLLDWTVRVASYTTSSDEAAEVFRTLSNFSSQPIEAVIEFAYEFRRQIDTMHDIIGTTGTFTLNAPIVWSIPDDISESNDVALEALSRRLQLD